MAPNCLQNKTAALSLELDKNTSKTGTGMEKWRVKGMGRSDSKVTSDSELSWLAGGLWDSWGRQARTSALPQGLHLKTWPRNTDPGTFDSKKG